MIINKNWSKTSFYISKLLLTFLILPFDIPLDLYESIRVKLSINYLIGFSAGTNTK